MRFSRSGPAPMTPLIPGASKPWTAVRSHTVSSQCLACVAPHDGTHRRIGPQASQQHSARCPCPWSRNLFSAFIGQERYILYETNGQYKSFYGEMTSRRTRPVCSVFKQTSAAKQTNTLVTRFRLLQILKTF